MGKIRIVVRWVLLLSVVGLIAGCGSSLTSAPKAPGSLRMGTARLSLGVGATRQLTLLEMLNDGNQTDVTNQAAWESSNPAVATVSAGMLTGLSSGNATITANLQPLNAAASITVHPSQEFLFATALNSKTISAWRIDVNTGALTRVTGSPFPAVGGQPFGLAVHPAGKFLYLVNQLTLSDHVITDPGGIAAYTIDEQGTPAAIGKEVSNTQQSGLQERIVIDSAGTHAYVQDPLSIGAASYTIDPGTGAVTPLNPLPFDFQDRIETADVAIVDHTVFLTGAGGLQAEAINSDGSLVTPATFPVITNMPLNRLAVSEGKFLYASTSLQPTPGPPEPPDTGHILGWVVNGDGSLTQIASTPVALTGLQSIVASRNLLFASSPAGITVYTVDSPSGQLKEIQGSPFPGGARLVEMNVDPSGKFLYVTSDKAIAAFLIGSTGILNPVPGSPFSTRNLQPLALASTSF